MFSLVLVLLYFVHVTGESIIYQGDIACQEMRAGNHKGDSFISFTMNNKIRAEMAVAIFNLKIYEEYGRYSDLHRNPPFEICSKDLVNNGRCTEELLGQYVPYLVSPLHKYSTFKLISPHNTSAYYEIEDDGVYCVITEGINLNLLNKNCGIAIFNNYFGDKTVLEFRLMKGFGFLALGYIIVTLLYSYMAWNSRHHETMLHREHIYLLIVRTSATILQWSLYKWLTSSYVHEYIINMFTVISEMYTAYQFAIFMLRNTMVLDSEGSMNEYDILPCWGAAWSSIEWLKEVNLTQVLGLCVTMLQSILWSLSLTGLESSVRHLKTSDPHSDLTRIRLLRYVMVIIPSTVFIMMSYSVGLNLFYWHGGFIGYDDNTLIDFTYHFMPPLMKFILVVCILYLWRPGRSP